jgi:formylglycine-generating enzyme required for sulfatase activity
MGSPIPPPENELHPVTLTRGFWMGTTPITHQQWTAVMGKPFGPTRPEDGALPVSGVSWDSAMRFCEAATRQLQELGALTQAQRVTLPTEAQWEYASRAGASTRWFFEKEGGSLGDHAWYRDNSDDELHPVARKKPNAWGLFDLYGNVPEWCMDNLYRYESQALVDPCFIKEGAPLRILRGGSYNRCAEDCSSVSREAIMANNPFGEDCGFRVACTS